MSQSEPRSEYYESQRMRMHYAVWGNGDKPPLLERSSAVKKWEWHFLPRGHGR